MAHVLRDLFSQVVKNLGDNVDILPAVGGAVEDMERPDVDEIEDVLINPDTREVTDFLEVPVPDLHNLYRPTPYSAAIDICIAISLTGACAPTTLPRASRPLGLSPSNWRKSAQR